jgi:hypothetical protein
MLNTLDHRQKRVTLVKAALGEDRAQISMERCGRLKEMEKLEEQRLCEREQARDAQLDRDNRDLEVLKQRAEGRLPQTKEAKQVGRASLGKMQPGHFDS